MSWTQGLTPRGVAMRLLGVAVMVTAGLAGVLATPPAPAHAQFNIALTELPPRDVFVQFQVSGATTSRSYMMVTPSSTTTVALSNAATSFQASIPGGVNIACFQVFTEPGGRRSDGVCYGPEIITSLDTGASAVGLAATNLTIQLNQTAIIATAGRRPRRAAASSSTPSARRGSRPSRATRTSRWTTAAASPCATSC